MKTLPQINRPMFGELVQLETSFISKSEARRLSQHELIQQVQDESKLEYQDHFRNYLKKNPFKQPSTHFIKRCEGSLLQRAQSNKFRSNQDLLNRYFD